MRFSADHAQADLLAHPGHQRGRDALEREAQAGFVLPAHLHRRQCPAFEREAVTQPGQSIGRSLASDFGDQFLLDRQRILGELAHHAPVLAEHRQAAGLGRQRHQRRELREMALHGANARCVVLRAVGRHQQALRFLIGHTGGLVQQQRDRLQRRRARAAIQLDPLVRDAELRLLDHDSVDAHPAALDVLLGLAARAGHQRGDALGQPDRFSHGCNARSRGQPERLDALHVGQQRSLGHRPHPRRACRRRPVPPSLPACRRAGPASRRGPWPRAAGDAPSGARSPARQSPARSHAPAG